MSDRPKTSNADEWALWLDEWKGANTAFLAVQIAEAIEEQRADLLPAVKPLAWGAHPAGLIVSNNTGSAYIIDTRGNRPRWLKWPGGHGPDRETVDEMQVAAQADYEARICACLDMTDPADEINRLRAQLAAAEADKLEAMQRVIEAAAGMCDEVAGAIGAAPTSSIYSALSEYRRGILSLTPADAQDALDAAIAKAVNEKLDAVVASQTIREGCEGWCIDSGKPGVYEDCLACIQTRAILEMKEPE